MKSESKEDLVLQKIEDAPKALINLVPRNMRQENGAFFTPKNIINCLTKRLINTHTQEMTIYDPSCGAGDLLLAFMKTFQHHNNKINYIGRDLHSEFTKATRLRLSTYAEIKNIECPNLKMIKKGDGLKHTKGISTSTHILMNPPYGRVKTPKKHRWGSGKVSEAAIFVDSMLSLAMEGTYIFAILPDVLRSGSNYKKWRKHITSASEIISIDLFDRFDSSADVHVFLLVLKMTKKGTPQEEWHNAKSEQDIIGSHFEVRVGTVVNFRDSHQGIETPYLHSKNITQWSTIKPPDTTRLTDRRTFKPPFVVVKRMSRPEDKYRAVGCIITGDIDVAVDNHLIVIRPHIGGVKKCEELLKHLKKKSTSKWLNERIRCRHLTVGALRNLPWE